ncbi:MAG: hypothetical protein V1494_04445 [Candidatus Diapherotrites archaeon]
MEKLNFVVLAFLPVLLFSGCLIASRDTGSEEPTLDETQLLEGVSCDATKPCPTNYECASFNGKLACYAFGKDPCSILKCPTGSGCIVAESYPPQIRCA